MAASSSTPIRPADDGVRGGEEHLGDARTRPRFGFFDQIAEQHAPQRLTPRRVTGPVEFPGKATAVIGMRRAGKTTFLHQVRAERLANGAAPERLPFVTLEDERLTGLDAVELGTLIDQYTDRLLAHSTTGREAQPLTWFLDEVQTVAGWERLVRRLIDANGVEVFVSGSSAALLSREIATELRGRAWQVLMHPFGFDEALRHAGVDWPIRSHAMNRADRARIEAAFADWLAAGGFPEAQGLDAATRRRLLVDYVDVALLRDVIDRHGVTNVVGLRWLSRQLLANAGAMFSVERFHGALRSQGVAIARDTVHQHLAHLEDCFLVRTVWMESGSERQRMTNPRKSYPIDAGLIGVFDRSGRANTGHALETAVLVELERRGSDVTYVRTLEGYEVDFLARHADGSHELIQVCADASDPPTARRELRALASASAMHSNASATLMTMTRAGLPDGVPTGVRACTAYEWILEAATSER